MRTYRDIFAVSQFRALFVARCIVMTSISLAGLALGTITYGATGSPVLTALSMFGGPLITLLGSSLVLGASDSLRPRTAMIASAVAALVADSLQAIPGMPWGARFAILAVPFLVASATGGSTVRLLTAIVPADGLLLGRATLNIAVGVMQVIGYGLGGFLLQWFSAPGLFVIAAVADVVAIVVVRLGVGDHRAVSNGGSSLLRRTRTVNRSLLGSRVTRPLYLCMWVPNGLIVGCEALFVPFAGAAGAGLLFATSAAGMLFGDVVMGRFIPPPLRDRLIGPVRLWLAAPYLAFFCHPALPVAAVLAFLASFGYCASLPMQERLLSCTSPDIRGQTFGLFSNGLMIGQSLGALAGGAVAMAVPPHDAMGILAVASALVTVSLTRGLRRSAPHARSGKTTSVEPAEDEGMMLR
ncbi:hypothetical protein [Allobranchiibius sp. GilTou73]|uniref:hypothetical protein n=1 Tax=Allobranchiibius sp. GilTou73 TaxID=2904523 RepID=UPI001F28614B|nr:hypothetical protein [Allobranchiibius sp. GilTou73]UIJ34981.1 hypothetical protein LVQ62_00775 [Allobranchiibius sp. GilTou73]